MIIFCITLFTSGKVQPIPAEIGTTIDPTPAIDDVIDVLVAPTITTGVN